MCSVCAGQSWRWPCHLAGQAGRARVCRARAAGTISARGSWLPWLLASLSGLGVLTHFQPPYTSIRARDQDSRSCGSVPTPLGVLQRTAWPGWLVEGPGVVGQAAAVLARHLRLWGLRPRRLIVANPPPAAMQDTPPAARPAAGGGGARA